jgi:hypothetical protein
MSRNALSAVLFDALLPLRHPVVVVPLALDLATGKLDRPYGARQLRVLAWSLALPCARREIRTQPRG